MKIEIYDPAMCCPTGVCGPAVDPELVRVQETLRQIRKQAPSVEVYRYGLSTDPQAFVNNPAVADLLKNEGPQCLPLVFVDGELLAKGCYPGNGQFGSRLLKAGVEVTLEQKRAGNCGCGPKCC